MIKTKCEKCIFKIMSNNKQIGCSHNIDQGISNLGQIYPENTIDRSNQYWTIDNFYCPYARLQEWADIISRDNLDINKKIADEVTMSYSIFQYVPDNSMDYLVQIIKTLQNAVFKPKRLSLIYQRQEASEISKKIKYIESVGLDFSWKIHNVIYEEMSPLDCINFVCQTNTQQYTNLLIMSKTELKTDLIDSNNYIFQNSLNKKIIVSKNMVLDTDFDFICFPYQLWTVAEHNIYTALGMIQKDLASVDDFYSIELQ